MGARLHGCMVAWVHGCMAGVDRSPRWQLTKHGVHATARHRGRRGLDQRQHVRSTRVVSCRVCARALRLWSSTPLAGAQGPGPRAQRDVCGQADTASHGVVVPCDWFGPARRYRTVEGMGPGLPIPVVIEMGEPSSRATFRDCFMHFSNALGLRYDGYCRRCQGCVRCGLRHTAWST
jgi:hypothetical protein